MNISIINKIEKFKNVSFDVFDTLIFRTVSDHHLIFKYISVIYEQEYGESVPSFNKDRVQAESNARNFYKREVSIDEIYDFLPYNAKKKERLKTAEKDFEIRNCIPNSNMIEVARWCVDNGKTVIITTDMYLTKDVFDAIFDKIGLCYDKIFISGIEGVSKRSGLLFPVVLHKMNINPKDLIHIGDDDNNDVIMPRKYNINVLKYSNDSFFIEDYISGNNTIVKDHLRSLFRVKSCNIEKIDSEYRIGYTVIGPFLYEFCQWIHKMKDECGIEKLLFVAREGFLIKQVYEQLFPEDGNQIGYISLNKNILRLPSLSKNGTVKTVLRSLPKRTVFLWNEIYKHLGIENEELANQYMQKLFPAIDLQEPLPRRKLLEGYCKNEIESLIKYQEKEILEQKKLLIHYVRSNEILSKKIGLVNNSMNGNAQYLLTYFLNDENLYNNIVGLQLIKTDYCEKKLGDTARSFIKEGHFPDYYYYYFRNRCLILEHLLFEPSGTARKLNMKNGNVDVICDNPVKEQLNYKKLSVLQSYALEFVRDYKKNIKINLNGVGVDSLITFFTRPYIEDARFISNLWDDDVEGSERLNPIDIPCKCSYIILKNVPREVGWIEAFIVVSGIKPIWLLLTKTKVILGFYIRMLFHRGEKSI